MSPVMIKVSGVPSVASEYSTVVSSVFGKQLANIQASFLSLKCPQTSEMVFSTASERKHRASGAGRRET